MKNSFICKTHIYGQRTVFTYTTQELMESARAMALLLGLVVISEGKDNSHETTNQYPYHIQVKHNVK